MNDINIHTNIIKELSSSNIETVKKTINKLTKKQELLLFPSIIELLNESKNSELNKVFISYLNNNKNTDTIDLFADAISNPNNVSILPLLVSACWQNGLDFSKYANLFINTYINEAFVVAIETFSVIEVMFDTLIDNQKSEMISKLKYAIPEMPEEKKKFTKELIFMLE